MKFIFVYVSKLDLFVQNGFLNYAGKLLVTNFGADVGNECTGVGVITQSLTYRMEMDYCFYYYSYYCCYCDLFKWPC